MAKVLEMYTLAQKWQNCQMSIEWHEKRQAIAMIQGDQDLARYHEKQIEAYRELQISLTENNSNDERIY